MNKQDLQVDGKYSPFSLKKAIATKTIIPNKITMLVDGTGLGIAHDDENYMYITSEECSIQANYYRENGFNGTQVPTYLYRHLHYMFVGEKGYKYKTEKDLIKAMTSGDITAESDEYKQIVALIKYCNTNNESRQVIGLIQLICGMMNIAKKKGKGVGIYLDKPEANLHPKRQSMLMTLIMQIEEDYKITHKPIKPTF